MDFNQKLLNFFKYFSWHLYFRGKNVGEVDPVFMLPKYQATKDPNTCFFYFNVIIATIQ